MLKLNTPFNLKKLVLQLSLATLFVFLFNSTANAFPYYRSIHIPGQLALPATPSIVYGGINGWTLNLGATGGTGYYTYSLPTAPVGATIIGGVVAYSPGTYGEDPFTVRVTDTQGTVSEVSFTLRRYETGTCVWTGATSTAWATASNWGNCSGAAPISTSGVAIRTDGAFLPTISGNTTISFVGRAPPLASSNGGTVTINAGFTLTISRTTNTVGSDIIFQGNTTTCSTCILTGGTNFYITDFAKLTLLKGITFNGAVLSVGNVTTAGQLFTGPAGTQAEWVRFANTTRFVIQGSATQQSILYLDGIVKNGISGNVAGDFYFGANFEIQKFDNIILGANTSTIPASSTYFNFASCTNSTITDTSWTEVLLHSPTIATQSWNLTANGTNCASMTAFQLIHAAGTTGGWGYGAPFESDTNNKVTWVNGDTHICTWTGATNSDWGTTSNWSNCTNGRLDIPDHLDGALIPVTATQPVVSTNGFAIKNFEPGTGGGTVTINAGYTLSIIQPVQSFQSDVKFQGNSTTCTTCYVRGISNLSITDYAKVTLLEGVDFGANLLLYVGNVGGTSAGQLFSSAASTDTTTWPILGNTTQTIVTGTAGQKSVISFDGLRHTLLRNSTTGEINFVDHYEIQKFDKIIMGNSGTSIASTRMGILFADCTNALITDTAWTLFSFPSPVAAGGYNVQATGTNCGSIPTITISSDPAKATADIGYGEAYDNDLGSGLGKIVWSDGDNLVCTWTGATSTVWREATNWNCPNNRYNYPDRYDSIVIPTGTPFAPTVSLTETVVEVATGTGGGTLTVNAGTWLVLSNSRIRSDIQFKGDTTTCSNCYVTGASGGNFTISDNAKVTLLSGIDLYANGGGTLFVGNGTTGGKLYTGTETGANRPSIGVGTQTRLYVNGASGQRSEISFDGLRYPTLSTIVGGKFHFNDWYDIKKFDNVTIGSGGTVTTSHMGIVLSICTNAVITDTAWTGFKFANTVTGSGKNIQASGTNCSTLPVITVSSTAADAIADLGYGPAYENDPNSKIDWFDGMALTCTWTGATSTVWTDSTNWNCPNNRYNYPDRYDSIVIPNVGFSPTLSASSTHVEIAPGTGGGILTINAGVTLTISGGYFKSDIQLKGDTPTCTTCRVTGNSGTLLWITNNSKMTLLSGIDIYSNGGTYLVVGNGTTGGKLYTGTEVGANRPSVGRAGSTSIYLWGGSLAPDRSELSLDGLQYPTLSTSLAQKFYFADYFDIKKFDNVTIGSGGTLSANHYGVYFASCTNAVITDTTWSGFRFPNTMAAGAKNIWAAGTNCSLLPTITVSSTPADATSDSGYGQPYENDPNNKIDWYDGSNITCTWTGTANSTWANSANWNCPNNRYNYPDRYDSIIIPNVGTAPILTASVSHTEIAAGTGGGTLTINNGVTLTLTNSSIKSDIQFAGNTPTCTTCRVAGSGNLSITDNAKVTLLSGIDIYSIGGTLNVGNGTTGGKLYTGTQTGNNRPSIGVTSATVVSINGAAGQPSEVSFDGLQYPTVSAAASSKFTFSNYYDIKKFDNVTIGPNGTAIASGLAGIRLATCTNATITDTAWTGFKFSRTLAAGGYNIIANDASCAGLTDITISSTPADAIADTAYGQAYELDHANNNIIWYDGMNVNCTWTGASSTAWANSANWNCPNNRNNYPDRYDSIIVPNVGSPPTLSSNQDIKAVAAGTGGGALTINNGVTLTLTDSTIKSDIQFAGNSSTCTTCIIRGSGNLAITDNAKVTLLSGVDIYSIGGTLNVGNGTTGGKLYTGTQTANNRPHIGLTANTVLYVNGGTSAAQRSEVSFDGLRHTRTIGNAGGDFIFNNWYDIKKFDNVTIGQFATALTANAVLIKVNNCNANALFTDTNWQSPEFANNPNATNAASIGTGSTCTKIYMKSATGAMSCATVPGSTPCAYESDPGNKIDWDP